MSLEEMIAAEVVRQLTPTLERLERALGDGRAADGLVTVPKAAKACGLSAETVRAKYLPNLKKYGAGRTLRISVADLRAAMAGERESTTDIGALADSIVKGRRHG